MALDAKHEQEAGDFPASDIAAALPVACNVPMDVLAANVEKAIARGLDLLVPIRPHTGVAVVVGGGPSTEDLLPEIAELKKLGAHVFALNGAGIWLRENNVAPHAVILLDARPHNARFAVGFGPHTEMLLASQCDASVFDAAKDNHIIMWHVPLGPNTAPLEKRSSIYIGGGTSTGMRAIRIAHVMGYRDVHLYGYDSSYRDGEAHAYDQYENADDVPREAICGGRAFVSTAWMIRQADDFQRLANSLLIEGMTIHVHGDGLLPEVARQMGILSRERDVVPS